MTFPDQPSTSHETSVAVQERAEVASPWVTVVWDDPVNLMSYVTYVFEVYFGFSHERAEELMRQVHSQGRAIVSSGSRERCERDTQAMHTYGLWATFEHSDAF
ncbi:ATP-dependent Clp protease adapter ClpS [Micrococcales bacterium 31B]|nr:ATP-dependent Clp protease adapter ClpS [Micrococcales bacterium 31B]